MSVPAPAPVHSHPEVHPHVPHGLIGTWKGQGAGIFPTISSFQYQETIELSHVGKPFLTYTQRTLTADGKPFHQEAGYIRFPSPTDVEWLIVQPTGISELLEGQFEPGTAAGTGTIRVQSTNITQAGSSKGCNQKARVVSVQRVYTFSEQGCTYVVSMATSNTPTLQQHLTAELTKQAD